LLNFFSLFLFQQLDSKKSPLALLAQTCSQIGADSSNVNVKSLVTPAEKSKKVDTQVKPQQPTANAQKMDKINELVFKPYEANVLSRKNGDDGHNHHQRPISKTSSVDENMSDESSKSNLKKDSNNSRVSSRNSNRESPVSVNSNNNNSSVDNKNSNSTNSHSVEANDSEKSQSENDKSPGLAALKESPGAASRSSLEMLQSQHKDSAYYKPGFNPFYPAGIDPTNPAFRSSFTSALSQHHASMLAAAAAGYPANSSNPYLSYARIKTPTGGEALVPVCKDPYCQGCQYSAHNQQMLMGVPCPPGCTQCEQQKYGLAMAMSSLPPNHPFAQMSKPFACNWIMNDGYCGRRFSTTDELIQHMKTHSPNLSDPATAASILAAQQSASLMSPLFFPPGMHRATAAGYPSTSPLSPLSASRYHPYAKPGSLPASYGSFNPALSAYYPPYSWMPPQRLGTAAHP
jgi:hypothetical protein